MQDRVTTRWSDYRERLDRVIDYMHDHLDEELNLNRLAEVACLSPYHWHRVYHAMLGETAAETVRKLRLHRAAGELVRSEAPLKEIAMRCGFNSVQSFSRVFREALGESPGEYRARGRNLQFQAKRKEQRNNMYDVKIQQLPAAKALTVAHRGPYMQIGRAFDHLGAWFAAHNAIRPGMRMVAMYYDDPSAVPESELRSCAGFILPEGEQLSTPFEEKEIPGGAYAILRHKGPYGELTRAYHWLYGQWLPQSGRDAADAPVFEEYLNTPRDTAPPDLLTDICLPLR